jgi:hypothetical protein
MNGGASDFWADAVTGQDCDRFANGTHVFFLFDYPFQLLIFSVLQQRGVVFDRLG